MFDDTEHELLNGINKFRVWAHLVAWLFRVINRLWSSVAEWSTASAWNWYVTSLNPSWKWIYRLLWWLNMIMKFKHNFSKRSLYHQQSFMLNHCIFGAIRILDLLITVTLPRKLFLRWVREGSLIIENHDELRFTQQQYI